MNSQPDPQTIEPRLRTMRILWIAMLFSIAIYYVFTLFVGRPRDVTPNPTLSLILLGVGLMTTLISFLIKSKFLSKAAEQQQVTLVQQGYIATWAMTEVAALLGVLDFFATGHPHYYVLFIIATLGMLLHFPRREAILNAAFKSQGF